MKVSAVFGCPNLYLFIFKVGTVFLAFLLAGVPGNKLGEYITSRSKSPTLSATICNICFILTTTGAACTWTC